MAQGRTPAVPAAATPFDFPSSSLIGWIDDCVAAFVSRGTCVCFVSDCLPVRLTYRNHSSGQLHVPRTLLCDLNLTRQEGKGLKV
jgi:hypothetical protein